MKAVLIEQALLATAKDRLIEIENILQGVRTDLIQRISIGRGLKSSHVVYDLVTTQLDFTDKLLTLFDYEDNGFSSEFRASIREVNQESYDLASDVISTLGKENVLE